MQCWTSITPITFSFQLRLGECLFKLTDSLIATKYCIVLESLDELKSKGALEICIKLILNVLI